MAYKIGPKKLPRITLKQAIEGYTLAAEARHLAAGTIRNYYVAFDKLLDYLGPNILFAEITKTHIQQFFASLPVAKITIATYHIALSALWTWCLEEQLVQTQIIQQIKRPRSEERTIEPYTKEEIKALLNALEKSVPYERFGERTTVHSAPQRLRNRAIILLMLDTGIRASKLCNLDIKERKVKIFGKRDKERILPFSSRTAQAVWRYITSRGENLRVTMPLFITDQGDPLNRYSLSRVLSRIGQRAGVQGVGAHRFRHTFAKRLIDSGVSLEKVAALLGHTSLTTTQIYTTPGQADLTLAVEGLA